MKRAHSEFWSKVADGGYSWVGILVALMIFVCVVAWTAQAQVGTVPVVGTSSDRINAKNTSADATGAGMAIAIKTAGKKTAILTFIVSTDTAMTVTISDEDGNFALAPLYPAARGGAVVHFESGAPWLFPTANKNIKVVASAAGNIGVTVTGYYYP